MLSDSLLLEKIRRQPKHAAGYKQLVRELGLNGNERQELMQRLEKLADAGQLLRTDGNRYAIAGPAGRKNVVSGTLSLHRDGYGFVIPDPSSAARMKSHVAGDIFISAYGIGSAMHGDRVLVEITSIRRDQRAEGRIIRSLERAHPTVVGLFHYASRHNFVAPLDPKLRDAIEIPPGREYPQAETVAMRTESARSKRPSAAGRQGQKQSRHRVIGGEARRPSDGNDLENVVVDVEITDWP
ncbi:MAG: ribonuclease R, partial [Acidobacteria bacterium]|nr:ribonuclease R [Acidobacteriota bacterium]